MDKIDRLLDAIISLIVLANERGRDYLNEPHVRASIKAEIQEALKPTSGTVTSFLFAETQGWANTNADLWAWAVWDLGGGNSVTTTTSNAELTSRIVDHIQIEGHAVVSTASSGDLTIG